MVNPDFTSKAWELLKLQGAFIRSRVSLQVHELVEEEGEQGQVNVGSKHIKIIGVTTFYELISMCSGAGTMDSRGVAASSAEDRALGPGSGSSHP